MEASRSAAKTETDDLGIEICVTGPFSVRGGDGFDLTPRPQKVRALLALLALSPDQRRSRQWLIDRLWSDRSPEQALGSLRQALVDLRKSFGDRSDVLLIDRESIGLAATRVRVVHADEPGAGLLEDVAVRDPSFREWRKAQDVILRSRPRAGHPAWQPQGLTASPSPDQLIMIGWGTSGVQGTAAGVVAEIIASRIAAGIAEQVPAVAISAERREVLSSGAPDIDITCNVIEDNGRCIAFIKVVHFTSGRVLFAKDFQMTGTAGSLIGSKAADKAVFEAAEKTAGAIPHVMGARRAVTQSTALGQLALHKMFSFDRGQLMMADKLLEQAYDLHESSVFLAWRGLLQMIKSIEMPDAGADEMREMAAELTRYATERDSANATVNALGSQTRAMMFGDTAGAMHFATNAVNANPNNPLALQAMAVAKMLAGENEDSYQLSVRARGHVAGSTFRHWWDAHHCTICVATGRIDEAITTGETALRYAASLRPVYRYLIALHADRNDLARAETFRGRLVQLEPGFTLDQMVNDPEYPVRTLRRAGLLNAVRKLL